MPKAIRFHKTGGPEVLQWEEITVGEPGEGQALIRHTAIGVNYLDTYHRSGLYPLPLPSGLGSEGAGIVEAVGKGVTQIKAGDRVAYAGPVPPFELGILAQKGSLYVTRPTLFTYTASRADLEATAKDLFDMVKSGKVKIEINHTYALKDAQQVHRDLEGRKTTGSIVMLP